MLGAGFQVHQLIIKVLGAGFGLYQDAKPIGLYQDAKPIGLYQDAKPIGLYQDAKPMMMMLNPFCSNPAIILSRR